MLNFSGFLHDIDVDENDTQNAFVLNCCGHYRLIERHEFSTVRPLGRSDYQLLYVAAGKMYFYSPNGTTLCARQGNAYLYAPFQPQSYRYFLKDAPDIYWMHFTGRDCASMLKKWGLQTDEILTPGHYEEYGNLFGHMIRELQLKKPCYAALSSAYAMQLLALFARNCVFPQTQSTASYHHLIAQAVEQMYAQYATPMEIKDYAALCNISIPWFIRAFRLTMGISPQQFMIRIRMGKARELLASSPYNISEIAAMVGYDNPLYFSRIFKKNVGVSPKEYRIQFLSLKR